MNPSILVYRLLGGSFVICPMGTGTGERSGTRIPHWALWCPGPGQEESSILYTLEPELRVKCRVYAG